MIEATFYKSGADFIGFFVSGHGGFGAQGTDIVCAAVSSVVELTCNTITEFFKLKAEVIVNKGGNSVSLKMNETSDKSRELIASLYDFLDFNFGQKEKIKLDVHMIGGNKQ